VTRFAFLRVGTLGRTRSLCRPTFHIFTSSKQPWVVLRATRLLVAEYYKAAELWPKESLERPRGTAGCELAAEVSVQRSLPMKSDKKPRNACCAVWLIMTGVIPLLHLSFSALGTGDGDPRHRSRGLDRRGR